jgi:hypothetical protein
VLHCRYLDDSATGEIIMRATSGPSEVVTVTNLAEFFRDALRAVLADQRLAIEEQTESYVVNMLTLFARAERLHEGTPEGERARSLVEMFSGALQAASAAERDLALQRIGDISLFMAGFFLRSFARRLVDVDYHIAMGGRAYGTLAGLLERGRRRGPAEVFAELAAKFQPLVDALGQIGDAAYVYTQRDILRLYEVWLKTGSVRARRLLSRLGIEATPVALRAH